jgi:hypothetical protein
MNRKVKKVVGSKVCQCGKVCSSCCGHHHLTRKLKRVK